MKIIFRFLTFLIIVSCSKSVIEETTIIDSPILGKWQQIGSGSSPNWNPIVNGDTYEFFSDGTYSMTVGESSYKRIYNVITDANSNLVILHYDVINKDRFHKEFIYLEDNNNTLILAPDHNCHIPCNRKYKRIP